MSATAWRVGSLLLLVALVLVWGEIAALKLVSPSFCRRRCTPGMRWSMASRNRTCWRN